jgi:hypothetical protein
MTDAQTTDAIIANDPFAARESADDAVPAETVMDVLMAWDSAEASTLYGKR